MWNSRCTAMRTSNLRGVLLQRWKMWYHGVRAFFKFDCANADPVIPFFSSMAGLVGAQTLWWSILVGQKSTSMTFGSVPWRHIVSILLVMWKNWNRCHSYQKAVSNSQNSKEITLCLKNVFWGHVRPAVLEETTLCKKTPACSVRYMVWQFLFLQRAFWYM